MKDKLKEIFGRYGELIRYLFIGGCTTVIGTGGYWLLVWLGMAPVGANVLSWCFAVIFAYFANKLFVFSNKESGSTAVAQFFKFIAARLFSLGVETALIWLGYDVLGYDKYFVKIPVAVVVVILNYITGKFMVFVRTGRRAGGTDK